MIAETASCSSSELLFKRIVIAMLAQRRARKLTYMAGWRARNPQRKKEWDAANKEHVETYTSRYQALPENKLARKKNIRRWRIANIAHVKQQKKEWEQRHPDLHTAARRRAEKRGVERHPHVAMRKRLKANIQMYLKRNGGAKYNRTCESIVGCDARFFAKWIASLFLPGMSFENRHLWQLDHVFPMACCGSNMDQILMAQNYRNFRPMWGKANHEKSYKFTDESLAAGFICGLSEVHITRPDQTTDSLLEKAKRLGFKIFNHYSESVAAS